MPGTAKTEGMMIHMNPFKTESPEGLPVIAHDLKNRLTAIDGYARLLRRHAFGEDEAYIERLLLSSSAALDLLNDITEESSLADGRFALCLSEIDVGMLALETVRAFQGLAIEKGIHLFCRSPRYPLRVQADEVRLRRVVDNLLSNAVKHTPAGGSVSVTVEEEGLSAGIYVVDNGEGIQAGEQGRVFDKFYQARKMAHGSVGLGLYICKTIVEAHGGSISAHSEGPGKGSIFSVLLPKRRGSKNAWPGAGSITAAVTAALWLLVSAVGIHALWPAFRNP